MFNEAHVSEAGSSSVLRQGQYWSWQKPTIQQFWVTGLDTDGRIILKLLLNWIRGCGLELVVDSCEHSNEHVGSI